MKDYKKGMECNPVAELYFHQGLTKCAQGLYEAAITDFEKAQENVLKESEDKFRL